MASIESQATTNDLQTIEPLIDMVEQVTLSEIPSNCDILREGLPLETLMGVLSYLTPKDLAIVSRLDSAYLVLAQDDMLWAPLCTRRGFKNLKCTSWKDAFKQGIAEQKRAEAEAAKGRSRRSRYSHPKLHKGGYALVDQRPCRIIDIAVSRVGKHGTTKFYAKGMDVFTGRKREQLFTPTSIVIVPEVTRKVYTVEGLETEKEGYIELIDQEAHRKKSMALPGGELGEELRELWQLDNVTITVTVVEADYSVDDLHQIHEEAIINVGKN